MEREGKREEEERKKREEEAKRGVRMKRWLEKKRSISVKKGLGPPGPGEGGVSNPVVDKFEECPDINSLLRGGGVLHDFMSLSSLCLSSNMDA
jgi:hypothetical protein